jgi:hypothetical protein
MSYRRRDKRFEDICGLATMRAGVAYRTANALLPDATNRTKMRIARRILSLCDGKDRRPRITEAQARELILPHLQCLEAQRDRCPLLCFWEPISRSLNMFFLEQD